MKIWGYYALHTFINSIKKMFRSTVVIIIFAILLMGFIFGISAGVIAGLLIEDENEAEGDTYIEEMYVLKYSDGELYEGNSFYVNSDDEITDSENVLIGLEYLDNYIEDEDMPDDKYIWSESRIETEYKNVCGKDYDWDEAVFADELISEQDIDILKKVMGAVAVLLTLFIVLYGLYSGSKKGSDIFLMADVNFLFVSPLKPQSVLMFRLSFQLFTMAFGMLYLLFQVPNLLNAGMSIYLILIIIFEIIILIIFQKIISILAYTITTTHDFLKKYIFPFVMGVLVIVGLLHYWVFMNNEKDFIKTIEVIYCGKYFEFIPLFGWIKGVVTTAAEGKYLGSLGYTMLIVLLMIVFIYIVWSIKADFYEDALGGAQKREELLIAAQEGQQAKKTKDRSDRIKRNAELKGNAASAFFYKNLYNRKRFAFLGIFTKTMITYIVITMFIIGISYMISKSVSFLAVALIIAVVQFFRSLANPLSEELALNWLIMVPDSLHKKVFMCIVSGTIICGIDLLPSMLLAGICSGCNPVEWVLMYILLLCLDFMLATVSALMAGLLQIDGVSQIKSLIQIMVIFFILMILVICFALGLAFVNVVFAILADMFICLVIGTFCFIVYPYTI